MQCHKKSQEAIAGVKELEKRAHEYCAQRKMMQHSKQIQQAAGEAYVHCKEFIYFLIMVIVMGRADLIPYIVKAHSFCCWLNDI